MQFPLHPEYFTRDALPTNKGVGAKSDGCQSYQHVLVVGNASNQLTLENNLPALINPLDTGHIQGGLENPKLSFSFLVF